MICPRCGRITEAILCTNCNMDFSLERICFIGTNPNEQIELLEVQHNHTLMSYIESIDTYSFIKRGWKSTAEEYETLGKQGDAKAQYELGKLYMSIWKKVGEEKDYTEGIRWYTRAAEQSYAEAQYELGEIYTSEKKGITDIKEAVKWYTLAAEQGHLKAMCDLADLYSKGSESIESGNKDIETDKEKAFSLYKRAFEQGARHAAFYVSLMLYRGEGTEQNLDEAAKWIKLALNNEKKNYPGEPNEKLLNMIYEAKELENAIAGIEDSLSKNQLREYKSLSGTFKKVNWLYDKDMIDDSTDAVITAITKKYKQTYYQHMPAAEEGFAFAQYEIAECYRFGWSGAPKDYKKALKWYILAATQGHVDAQYDLGFIYDIHYRELEMEGEEAKQKAFNWYKKAAYNGDKRAIKSIAKMYIEGTGTEKNLDEAIRMLRPVAMNGDDDAIQLLMDASKKKNFEGVLERIAETLNESQHKEYQKIDDLEMKADWIKENVSGADFVIAYEKTKIDEQIKNEITDIRSNPELEINRYMTSAEEGDADDQYRIGDLYRFGRGGAPHDLKEAVKWYTFAAEQGNSDAQYDLGEIYRKEYNHLGIEANEAEKKAFAYYKQASEHGNKYAMTSLAKMYYEGKGTERNLSCAIRWALMGFYDATEMLQNAIEEEFLNRIVGRSFSQLTVSQIEEYKTLESSEERADWIRENVLEYETIVKDISENMQTEFDIDLSIEGFEK